MGSLLVSLSQLQEVSPKNMILVVVPPGAGKSTFCQQAVLQNLALDRPVIYVTTECGPSEVERALRERGLGEIELGLLNFVDVYNETVGVSVSDRPDPTLAECEGLSSIGIAISKLQQFAKMMEYQLFIFSHTPKQTLLWGPHISIPIHSLCLKQTRASSVTPPRATTSLFTKQKC